MKLLEKIIALLLIIAGCLQIIVIEKVEKGAKENIIYEDFAEFKKNMLELPRKNEPVTLVAVGDIMLSRGVATKIEKHGIPEHLFLKIKEYLKGDVVFGNLEGPITEGREILLHEMKFRADPEVSFALKEAGFNVLALANNHILDFDRRGLFDTIKYLEDVGIEYVGAGKSAEEASSAKYIDVKGKTIAFLGYVDPSLIKASYALEKNPSCVALFNEDTIVEAIREAKRKSDLVIVSLHVGTEYAPEPDSVQRQYAHLAVDAGADIVLGHHPHVVQRVERYKGKYIFYSLGNFIFDQLWSQNTRESVLAKIFLTDKGVERVEFIPLYINDESQPRVLEDGKRVVKRLGLYLQEMTVPVWDATKHVFTGAKKYIYFPEKNLKKFKLIKRRADDLNGDGIEEIYSLKNGKVKVDINSETCWYSPDSWWVDDFILGDSNNDGVKELNLLVWKEGSFGSSKPFWLKEEDKSIRNHLFIFKLEDGEIKPVWQSSNLDRPNYHIELRDLDVNGENEMIATEGSYTDPDFRKVTLWKWNGWGFTRINYEQSKS